MNKIKVENYGDLLSKAFGFPCVAYVLFGSYQGEWVAALDKGETIELWKGYYGSCSGCDALEYHEYEMTEEEIKNYFKEDRPFLEIPKSIIKEMTLEQFNEIFPANVRNDIYEYNEEEMFKAIKEARNA